MDIYRKFWLETEKYEHPPRYGYDWFISALDKVWDDKDMKTDWLGLEQVLRDCLSSTKMGDAAKVLIAAEAIAAFTRRGPIDTHQI